MLWPVGNPLLWSLSAHQDSGHQGMRNLKMFKLFMFKSCDVFCLMEKETDGGQNSITQFFPELPCLSIQQSENQDQLLCWDKVKIGSLFWMRKQFYNKILKPDLQSMIFAIQNIWALNNPWPLRCINWLIRKRVNPSLGNVKLLLGYEGEKFALYVINHADEGLSDWVLQPTLFISEGKSFCVLKATIYLAESRDAHQQTPKKTRNKNSPPTNPNFKKR